MVDGTLILRIPAAFSAQQERHWIQKMAERFERRSALEGPDPMARAMALAEKFGLGKPASVRWSENQNFRWGSCTPATASIRLSARLARLPDWVVDYVIVHELAHLSQPNHQRPFWDLVERYPLTERARGFLIAVDGGWEKSLADTPGPAAETRGEPELGAIRD